MKLQLPASVETVPGDCARRVKVAQPESRDVVKAPFTSRHPMLSAGVADPKSVLLMMWICPEPEKSCALTTEVEAATYSAV